MDVKQVVLTMAERFASDNLIALQRAQITRDEWGAVALELQRLEKIEAAARTTLACAAEGPILNLARASLELHRLLELPPD